MVPDLVMDRLVDLGREKVPDLLVNVRFFEVIGSHLVFVVGVVVLALLLVLKMIAIVVSIVLLLVNRAGFVSFHILSVIIPVLSFFLEISTDLLLGKLIVVSLDLL